MQANQVKQTARQKLLSWPLLVVLNLLVALTGYLKDLTIAAYLGTSPTADAFTTAYFIVDLVGVLALGNAVGLASAAVFGPLAGQDKQRMNRLVHRTAWTVVACSAIVGVLLLLLRHLLLVPFATHGGSFSAMSLLYLVFLPTVVFYPLFYFFSGVLQAVGRYALSVGAPFLLNLVVTFTGIVLMKTHTPVHQGSIWLALSIPVGSMVLALLVSGAWIARVRHGRLVTRQLNTFESSNSQVAATDSSSLNMSETPFVQLLQQLFPIILGYGIYLLLLQGLGLIERYIVSLSMPSGSLAAMTYANRLGQIPNWVFMSAVATWLIPHLVRANHLKQYTELATMVRQGLTLCIGVGVPMTFLFLVLRVPIVATLFQHGQFTAASTRGTAAFLAGYAVAMTFQALSAFLFRVVITTSDMRKPILYALVGVAVSALAIAFLIPHLGAVAIGMGEAIGNLVTTTLLWKSFCNYTGETINFPFRKGLDYAVSNIAVIGMSIVVRYIYLHVMMSQSSAIQFVFLAISITVIFLVYTGFAFRQEILGFWGRV